MSVVKSKRTTSKFEYFRLGIKIHDMIYTLVMQDFGFKTKTKDFYAFTNKADMDDEDKEEFKELCEKYDINLESKFPSWMLEHFREKVLKYDDLFLDNLVKANSTIINSVFEFNLKRGYIWECISCLHILLQYFQSIIRMIPMKPERKEKYAIYVKMMDEENDLLRRWKKDCNKQFSQAYKKDVERNNRAITKNNNYTDSKATNMIPADPVINAASNSINPETSFTSSKKIEKISSSLDENTKEVINPFSYVCKDPFYRVLDDNSIARNPFHKVIKNN